MQDVTLDRLLEFSGNHPSLFIAFVVVAALLAWSFVRSSFQGFRSIDPVEATQLINHRDAVVLDIRDASEMKEGKILNAIHIPLAELQNSLKKLERYKGRPIIASCRTGSRSQPACAALIKNGFEEVYNLRGGIVSWQSASLPLEKKK